MDPLHEKDARPSRLYRHAIKGGPDTTDVGTTPGSKDNQKKNAGKEGKSLGVLGL